MSTQHLSSRELVEDLNYLEPDINDWKILSQQFSQEQKKALRNTKKREKYHNMSVEEKAKLLVNKRMKRGALSVEEKALILAREKEIRDALPYEKKVKKRIKEQARCEAIRIAKANKVDDQSNLVGGSKKRIRRSKNKLRNRIIKSRKRK
jgi:hypothetical protein